VLLHTTAQPQIGSQARIDTIRAAGYPVTCAELDQWYKIPPNVENAAYTIIDAFSYYNQWDKEKSKSLPVVGRAELPARTEPLTEEMKALIAQYVADNNEALELLHIAAKIENCRYPIDLSAGTGFVPNCVKFVWCLFTEQGCLHAENGDGNQPFVRQNHAWNRSFAQRTNYYFSAFRAACKTLP
jgi:hypothetical protein